MRKRISHRVSRSAAISGCRNWSASMLNVVRVNEETETSAPMGQFRKRNQTDGSWGSWLNIQVYSDFRNVEFASGQDLVNYHARLRRKELLPLTAYTWFSSETYYSFHKAQITDSSAPYNPTVEYNLYAVRRGSEVTRDTCISVTDQYHTEMYGLVQAAAARIYSSGWDGLTFALEVKKLKRMLVGFAKRFVHLVLSGRFDKLWLEGRYGWRPLWYDMKDIANAIENLDGERRRFKETVGFEVINVDQQRQTSSWLAADVHTDYTITYTVGLRGTVVADIAPPRVRFNPVTTAWELLTFSFIVDWILDVGRFLDAVSFLSLATKHYSAGGFEVAAVSQLDGLSTTPKGTTDVSFTDQSGPGEGKAKLRVRIPAGIPHVPLITPNIDIFKVADILALILGRLKR